MSLLSTAALMIVSHNIRSSGRQRVLINQLVCPTRPFVARQVKGRNIGTKYHENIVTTMPCLDHGSPCFVTMQQQRPDLLLLIMKRVRPRDRDRDEDLGYPELSGSIYSSDGLTFEIFRELFKDTWGNILYKSELWHQEIRRKCWQIFSPCEEIERIWGNWEEMEREWGNGVRDRMTERKNFISVFPSLCCKTLKFLTFVTKQWNMSLFVAKC